MFPIELKSAVEYLQHLIKPCNRHKDGRLNSAEDEDNIIQKLKDRYGSNVVEPKIREWYDVELFGYKVNIKSSGMNGSDNANAKAALLYCFTSGSVTNNTWSHFYDSFENVVNQGRNYYFIVFDKNTGKVYLQSLLTLAKLTPNGSNLPFQVYWKDNLVPVERSFQEAYDFLISAFKESVRKKLKAHIRYDNL